MWPSERGNKCQTEPQLLSPISWFLSFLVNGQRKRARKNLVHILCNSIQSGPIESRSNIIPCFCTQARSSLLPVPSIVVYLSTLADFFLGPWYVGGTKCKERGEKKQKGVKVVDLPSVHFLDLFGPPNEVQKQRYTRCKISFYGDIVPNNWTCASSHSKTVRTGRIVFDISCSFSAAGSIDVWTSGILRKRTHEETQL